MLDTLLFREKLYFRVVFTFCAILKPGMRKGVPQGFQNQTVQTAVMRLHNEAKPPPVQHVLRHPQRLTRDILCFVP